MISSVTRLNELDKKAPIEGLAGEVHKTKNVLKAVWDFAVQGGAVGSLLLLDDRGNPAKLPSGSIITGGLIEVITALTSTGGTGTVALTANAAADLLAAVDADTLSALHALIPVGTAATAIKLTAERQITLTIATNALLTGKIAVYIDYYAGAAV